MPSGMIGRINRPRLMTRCVHQQKYIRMCQRSHLDAVFWILLFVVSWATSAGHATAQPSLIGRSKAPIQGAKPKDKIDQVRAERFLVDPPTLENLGFRWYVSGDSNRNATVTVAFREQGEGEWTAALPMLRVHYEIANQDYRPYRVGTCLPGVCCF